MADGPDESYAIRIPEKVFHALKERGYLIADKDGFLWEYDFPPSAIGIVDPKQIRQSNITGKLDPSHIGTLYPYPYINGCRWVLNVFGEENKQLLEDTIDQILSEENAGFLGKILLASESPRSSVPSSLRR